VSRVGTDEEMHRRVRGGRREWRKGMRHKWATWLPAMKPAKAWGTAIVYMDSLGRVFVGRSGKALRPQGRSSQSRLELVIDKCAGPLLNQLPSSRWFAVFHDKETPVMCSILRFVSIAVTVCILNAWNVGMGAAQQSREIDSRRFVTGQNAGSSVPSGIAEPIRSQLPSEPRTLVERFESKSAEIQRVTDGRIGKLRRQLIETLKPMQDEYTRQANLDAAVAIRDCVRLLRESGLQVQPDPGNLANTGATVGSVRYFRVMGRTDGSVWGSNIYTTDSMLATAAVHAGAVKNRQTGIVKVTLLPGQASYQGAARNGVVSRPWQSFPMSFTVVPATEDEAIGANDEVVVSATSVEKTPSSVRAIAGLVNRNVVIYFANGSVSGKVSGIDGDCIVVEGEAGKPISIVNAAAFTYITILPEN
jgi:hypothetical protein